MHEPAVINQPVIVEPDDGFTLRLGRKPEAIVAEATLCADALLGAVRRNQWAQKFGNREHLFFEAWSFLAAMYRVTPRIKETRLVQTGDVIGYEATAEAFHVPSGIVISSADAMCLNDEDNWSSRPEYEWDAEQRKRVQVGEKPVPLFQLRSMAQTRAMSKALKGPFSWVVAMAGYAPTPAEEMRETRQAAGPMPSKAPAAPREQQPEPPAKETSGPARITGKQASRLWAIGFSASVDKKLIGQVLASYGFERAEHVTVDRYEELCGAIENL